MAKGQEKKVKTPFPPEGKKSARVKENPGSYYQQPPVWQFHRCDVEHEHWGWNKLTQEELKEILHGHLRSFEGMTWANLLAAAGGKGDGKGTNSHNIPLEKFSKSAKERLAQLHLDDIDELFSLRLANTVRLYGILENGILKLIWHDPYHEKGNKLSAYDYA